MSLFIANTNSQISAADEYNEYTTQRQDLIQEFEQEAMEIMERYDDPKLIAEAMEELENRPKYFRHCYEMRRLIRNMKDEDDRAARKSIITGTAQEADPYWSIITDHRHPLNHAYEKSKRVIFDMGRGTSHEVSGGPRKSTPRPDAVKFTEDPKEGGDA